MNETLFLLIMIASVFVVVGAAWLGRTAVQCCAIALALTTTVIAGKVVTLFGLSASAGTCCYAAIFLCTDVIAECWGRREALKTVVYTFGANAMLLGIGFLAVQMNQASSTAVGEALEAIFEFLPRLLAGGLIAFIVSQTFDVWFFHWIKSRTNGRHLWLRNNASTMVSQAIDTILIWHIAFWGVVPNIWSIILVSYVVKVAVALTDTPFCYLAVRLTPESRRARS